MLVKRYYCSKCGAGLQKEKTHRVVTKDDVDYYIYQDFDKFPRRNHDVYEYRFKCPSCQSRISFEEQCIINKIQKSNRSIILSPIEIRKHRSEYKKYNIKRAIISELITIILIFVTVFGLAFLISGKNFLDLDVILFFIIFVIASSVSTIRKYKKKRNENHFLKIKRSYTYEKECLMKKLHAYSSHNKELIENAEKCYCFYCKKSFGKNEINNYTDNGQTALCPHCGIDSVLPDSIEENIDNKTLSDMNKYWF